MSASPEWTTRNILINTAVRILATALRRDVKDLVYVKLSGGEVEWEWRKRGDGPTFHVTERHTWKWKEDLTKS